MSGDARPELIRVGTEDRAVLHSIEAGGAERNGAAACGCDKNRGGAAWASGAESSGAAACR
mgnify:CR=1 FL=1